MARKVGDVIMLINGVEVPLRSCNESGKTGRAPAEYMSSDPDNNDFIQTGRKTELDLEALIPADGPEFDLHGVVGAEIMILTDDGGWMTTWTDVYTTEVGGKWSTGEAAIRSAKAMGRKARPGGSAAGVAGGN